MSGERPTGGPGIRISYSDALAMQQLLEMGRVDLAIEAIKEWIERRQAEVEAELPRAPDRIEERWARMAATLPPADDEIGGALYETEGGPVHIDGRTIEDDGFITVDLPSVQAQRLAEYERGLRYGTIRFDDGEERRVRLETVDGSDFAR